MAKGKFTVKGVSGKTSKKKKSKGSRRRHRKGMGK